MNKKFTKLMAALALLTFLAVPMGMRGQATTFEQLTSIADIDEDAQYVLGIDGTGFHYSNTSGWGLTGLPEDHTPYYYRLMVAEDGQSFKAYVDTPIYGNTYYMTIPTTNAFTMTTDSNAANTDLIIGTTCTGVSTPNYAVANKTTTERHLRRNGSSGLRSYAGTTGSVVFFYKKVVASGPVQLDAPTLTATSSNGKVTLTWDNVNGASSYTVQYADNSSFTGATTITNATSPNEISGLTNGTTYYFKAMSVGDGTDYLSSDYCTAISSTPSNYVTITITQEDIEGFTNTYDWYDWSDGGVSGKLYAYKNAGMQFNSTKTAYWIYNSTAVPGKITSVKMTKASGTDRSWTLKAGNTALTATSDGTQIGNAQTVGTNGATWNVSGSYNYFLLYVSGGSTVISSIEITYTPTSASDPSITAADVNIAYDAEEGTINYTINNPVEGGSIVASTEAEWLMVDDEAQTDAEGSIDFLCAPNSNFYAHSATVTLTYTYGDSKATVTKDIMVTQALDPDANGSTAEYPIMVSEAIEAIDEVGSVSNIYVGGIVSNIETEYSSQHDNITFDMIDEEGDEYFVRAYRCVSTDDVDASEVAVGDYVIVKGNLMLYNSSNGSIYELAQGCQLVSLIHPAVPSITVNPDVVELDAEEHDGTLDLTYENLTITEMTDFNIQFCDANGDELSEQPDWIEVLVAEQDPEIGEGYVVSYYMVENEGTDARTAYFKVYAMDDETNLVYSNLVTISQAAPVAPVTGDKYVKVTSTDDLTSGQYLIVYEEGPVAFDGSLETLDAASNTIEVILYDDEIDITSETAAAEFTIDITAGTIKSASGYYIGQTSDANGMQTSLETAYTNTISFEDGNANIVSGDAYLRYNSASNQTRFRYYKSSSYTNQKAIQLYKKVGEEPAPETYTLTIEGFGNDNTVKSGWHLIASPVATTPLNVTNMLSNTYDLYRFNPTDKKWENYHNHGFDIVPGKGYLYANSETVELSFTGIPYNENGEITIEKAGWNLIGNPFYADVTVDNGRDFFKMNEGNNGSEIILADQNSRTIAPMRGIFVKTTEDNQTVTFTKVSQNANANNSTPDPAVTMNLVKNRGNVIDRAIVRFGGNNLPKFQLFENSTKLYIPQGAEEFAIVNTEAQGEMPVNFKAAENGTYTLNINAEGVKMNYLHLIDNMTGADIDLVATPSYTFEANTTDYESRFRLVFDANASTSPVSFAYFNGSEWVVDGNGTLQVVDVMGRVVSTTTVNGNASVSLNAPAGVYMLRLINGNEVKVQKMVVR